MAIWECKQCGKEFERNASKSRPAKFCVLKCYYKWRKENNITTGQFKKGNVPWTKGKKGIHVSPNTEFKKGHNVTIKHPIGTIKIRKRKRGNAKRAWIKIGEPNIWIKYATYIWGKINGKLPEGYFIHHIDGNTLNDDIINLKMVNRGEHLKLHRPDYEDNRLDALRRASKRRWDNYRKEKVSDIRPGETTPEA